MSDVPNKEWICQNCGHIYAEYVNGCPKCWEAGDGAQPVRLVGIATPTGRQA